MSIFSLILILELSLEVLILVYNLVDSSSWLAVVTSYVIHFLRLTSQVYHQQSLSLSKVLQLLRLNIDDTLNFFCDVTLLNTPTPSRH